MEPKNLRAYHVVVWGATGFTGKLVAEYLLQTYGTRGDLHWAIAGRNRAKLEDLKRALGESANDLDVLVADANDEASLDVLTSQAAVICTTVGPYAAYGSKLVAACVRQGTDCCDLCGEPIWMRRMIDQHHEAAKVSGARIVNACGYDSIPSDCGVAFLNAYARQKTGYPCRRIAFRFEQAVHGDMSGGTIASAFSTQADARRNRSSASILKDPYALNPPRERSGPDGRDLARVAFDVDLDAWISPFAMAFINTRIVRRTNALLGYPYGRDFRYEEAVLAGKGTRGRVKAHLATVVLGAFAAGITRTPRLVRPLLPRPGQGPSRERRETGSFSILLVGQSLDGKTIKARVTGKRDPGYGCTSRMLGESAVCLARDSTPAAGGILTPASAMQEQLLPRLVANAGLTFEVVAD